MARSNSYPTDLRDRLVSAAHQRLLQEAPEQMSLRLLAASENTSTNAIYSIFGGKGPLIAAVIDRARADFTDEQAAAIEGTSGWDCITAAGLSHRAWARRQPALYRLIFSGDASRRATISLYDPVLVPLRSALAELTKDGATLDRSVDSLTWSIWASLHGFILLELVLSSTATPQGDALFTEHLAGIRRGHMMPAEANQA